MTTITITFNPDNIDDFLKAVQAVSAMPEARAVVSIPKGYDGPIARYCAAKGQKKYTRLQSSVDADLSALDDLRARAESGDEIAKQALQESQDELPENIPAAKFSDDTKELF